MKPIVFMCGMMGSGKTTVGKRLSERLEIPFFDTDALIEAKAAMSVAQIISQSGIDGFRELENQILRTIPLTSAVVSTGGGILTKPENQEWIAQHGLSVYLRSEAATLISRLRDSRHSRPLLQSDDWELTLEALLADRDAAYSECDICVDTDEYTVDDICTFIIASLEVNQHAD